MEQDHAPSGAGHHERPGGAGDLGEALLAQHTGAVGPLTVCGRQQAGQRRPVPHVVPAELAGHHGHSPGCRDRFSDGMVDRDPGQGRPLLGEHLVSLRAVPGGSDRAQPGGERRLQPVQVRQQYPGTDHEHAGVPPVGAGGEVLRGSIGVGLLSETEDLVRPVDAGHGRAEVDVAEGGGGTGGFDTDRGHVVRTGQLHSGRDRTGELLVVGDHVVGGEGADHHILVRVPDLEHRGGQPDGGHRVPRGRFGEQVIGRQVGQLLGHRRGVGGAGDHQLGVGQRGEPVPGGLHQGPAAASQVVQELRGAAPGQRPEPGAGTARGHDGVERLLHRLSLASGLPGSLRPAGHRTTCAGPSRSDHPSTAVVAAVPRAAPAR